MTGVPNLSHTDFSNLQGKASGRRGGLMFGALDSGSSGPGSNLGRGTAVCFWATLNAHYASLHTGVYTSY